MMKYMPLFCVLFFCAVITVASNADWRTDTKAWLAEMDTMDAFCGPWTIDRQGGLWCIGKDGRNLYQWKDRTFAPICDGVVDTIMLLPNGSVAVQRAGDPDTAVWWTPKTEGQCKAVRVTVQ